MSCSARRSIFSTSSLSTFSLSLSSSCCVVSMQYSAVQRMLHVWHCSSSVNFTTSPSFNRLWIRLLADAIVGCCLENRSSWPDKLSCLLILQHTTTKNSCSLMDHIRPGWQAMAFGVNIEKLYSYSIDCKEGIRILGCRYLNVSEHDMDHNEHQYYVIVLTMQWQ